MILRYDPVAKELSVDLEDGRPQFDVRVDGLVVEHYAEGALLFAELGTGGVTFGYHPDPDYPAAVEAVADGARRWRVVTTPA